MFVIPSGVTALSFDIWKTLLHGNKAFTRPRLRLIFDRLGYPDVDVEQLRAAYLKADKFFNDKSERDGLDYGLVERLVDMYQTLGIDARPPFAFEAKLLQKEVGELRLRPEYMPSFIEPDILETLRALKGKGLKLGLLSNTGIDDEQVMQPVLQQLGIWDLVDTAIFSSEDGRAKPNAGIFWEMAHQLDAHPQEVLHIGDNPVADYGARSAGLQAILYAPDGSNLPHIRSMSELRNTPKAGRA